MKPHDIFTGLLKDCEVLSSLLNTPDSLCLLHFVHVQFNMFRFVDFKITLHANIVLYLSKKKNV